MNRSWLSIATTSVFSVLAASCVLGFANAASAQTVGMSGSYIGTGVAVGVTTQEDEDVSLGGNVQARLDTERLPVSLRGAFLFNGDNSAVMPIVSYDIGVAPNTNVYVGGGYSFVLGDEDSASSLGDQNAPVVTVGAETALQQNLVLYGDVKVGIDAYKESSDAAVSLQLGAAYRF